MKVKIKGSILSLLLSLCLALSVPFSSLADLATDSQAVYDTDYESIQPLSIGITPMSSISTITNTVDYSGALVVLTYYDMSNVLQTVTAPIGSDGSFKLVRPSNFALSNNFSLYLNRKGLPPAGNYDVIVDFALHTPMQYGSSFVFAARQVNNASTQQLYSTSFSLVQNYGDFQVSGVIQLGQVSDLQIGATNSGTVPSVIDGVVRANFTLSSSSPNVVSPGASSVDQDIQSSISDNTGALVEQQEETNGLLVEIIQTISNQLKAFWDQLAGEFTNLYNKMNQQHQEKLDADRNNTEDIISNQNQNTNQIVNGYDSSALDNSSNNLNDSLTEFSGLQNSISESMAPHLKNFEPRNLNDYPSGVLGSLLFFGNYMQYIFDAMNNFNLPITLGFTLTFVLMLIGYFRYGR